MRWLRKLFGRKALIVVIDDSDELAAVLSYFLRLEGYRVKRAADGYKGVVLVQKILPDLVILDISLPNMDGKAVLALLKSDPKTQGIPVVMCTTSSMLRDVEKCCSDGAAGYILKPFDPEKALEKIESTLRRARGTGP